MTNDRNFHGAWSVVEEHVRAAAYNAFYYYPALRLNQINWPVEIHWWAALVTGETRLLHHDCRLQFRRFADALTRVVPPFRIPFSRWWNQIGCASRAFDPQRKTTSVSSTSRYELVPPPAPNTVARPTTLGACHVRLQLSMLFVPNAARASFCARKFTSLVDFEQEKMPSASGPR